MPNSIFISQGHQVKDFEDHSTEAPAFTLPGIEDPLSKSLRVIAQKAKDLVLGNVLIGDEFFWPPSSSPSPDGDGTPYWPFLSSLRLGIRLTTPDGRWRFDYAEPESESESHGDDESCFDDSDYEEVNKLRRRAVPDIMNNFYRAAARAALEMPKLEIMVLGFNGWRFKDVTFHTFIYEVKDHKVTVAWYSYPAFEPDEDVVECWEQVGLKYHNTLPEIIIAEERAPQW